jgi:hypothetical protein
LRKNCLLKHVTIGKNEGRKEEDVGSYWITVKKYELTGT